MIHHNLGTPTIVSDHGESTAYNIVADQLRTWILAHPETPLLEVTAAAPTPAFLRPYASTVPANPTPDNDPQPGDSVTFYVTSDPGLDAAPGNLVHGSDQPHCRLVRIAFMRYKMILASIDTLHADPSVIGNWCTGSDDAYDASIQGSDTAVMLRGAGSTTLATGGRFSFSGLLSDSSLVILISYISSVGAAEQHGGGAILTWQGSAGPGSRDLYPDLIQTSTGQGLTVFSSDGHKLFRPGYATLSSSDAWSARYPLGPVVPQYVDAAGREYVQRPQFLSVEEQPCWTEPVTCLLVTKQGLSPSVGSVRRINGHVCLKIRQLTGEDWWVTSEPPAAPPA